MKPRWNAVLPAITTPIDAQGRIDHDALAEHALWMVDAGCEGIVALGSLGESATLSAAEKRELLQRLGHGSERVRGPRLALTGAESEDAQRVIDHAIAHRPVLAGA